eukprot:CAMPEP_0197829398 /NCGR_PEP_ID=MMETSP1437-20131217/5838_1 /TAXON_ID=49252 ORGANISM="Eucampia antarctica, Strain CCMP1452" /NCGR_SAMPLE_ID=MMETSP1437 /ASSEMBLY_ACC=CAM_ASM_001096 /LENGTH=442 /DNA_ID=CAMNT_0043431035 /DNA_START=298 /DNA_END=1626 /DNA_ORIENTATION=+
MYNPVTIVLCISWFMLSSHVANSELIEKLTWSWNTVKMNYKAADVIATYMKGPNGDEDGFIIITGGCDHVDGNVGADDGNFYCGSITDKALKFDPFGNSFSELEAAPHKRYRHSAVAIGKKLYLIGGRDLQDNFVEEIDVYDTETEKWRTAGKLPNDKSVDLKGNITVTSDLAAWGYEDHIYVAGGYSTDYTSFGTTYRIAVADLKISQSTTPVTATLLKSMNEPRGDIHAVEYEGYAYIFGGFSSADNFCKASDYAERYHIQSDTWETLDNMKFGRGDMGVAELFGKIMAIGGESKPQDCTVTDPDFASVPQNHVEVFDPVSKKFLLYTAFNDYRYRFGAASVPIQDRVYTFGGQIHYNKDCNCFPTSDEVGIAQESLIESESPGPSSPPSFRSPSSSSSLNSGAIAGIVIGCVGGVIGLSAVIFFLNQGDKQADTAMLTS